MAGKKGGNTVQRFLNLQSLLRMSLVLFCGRSFLKKKGILVFESICR
jgi:hypothetical protein